MTFKAILPAGFLSYSCRNSFRRIIPTGVAIMLAMIFAGNFAGTAFATDSTISLTLSGEVVLNLAATSSDGTFGTSSEQTILIISDHYSGYTLSITGSDDNGQLIGANNASNYFSSITSEISKDTFSPDSSYNNMWGFLPSKYNSSSNSNYLPAPTTSATILDTTSAANSTANTYTLAVGARANVDTAKDSYSNTFVITAVGNPSAYQATYNANTTATVSELPDTTTGTLSGGSFTVSSTTPTRSDGYIFTGWCVGTATADSTACDGTTISAGETYTFSSVDQTTLNTITLYAMWGKTIFAIDTMQEMTTDVCDNTTTPDSTATTLFDTDGSHAGDTSYVPSTTLTDTRGNNTYEIEKLADGHCWMTQNLDLDLSTTTTLTSENTDLTTSGSGAYSTGYSTSGGVISWTPSASTLTDVSSWSNNNNNPYSFNPGTYYQNGTYFSSSICNYTTTTCDNFSTTAYSTNGAHGAVGNYYNWSAAIASNDSSSLTSSTYDDISDNPKNSICPANWRLPTVSSDDYSTSGSTDEFSRLNYLYNSGSTSTDTGLFNSPPYFPRAGDVCSGTLCNAGYIGRYWSSTVYGSSGSYSLGFASSYVYPALYDSRDYGRSVRCVAR